MTIAAKTAKTAQGMRGRGMPHIARRRSTGTRHRRRSTGTRLHRSTGTRHRRRSTGTRLHRSTGTRRRRHRSTGTRRRRRRSTGTRRRRHRSTETRRHSTGGSSIEELQTKIRASTSATPVYLTPVEVRHHSIIHNGPCGKDELEQIATLLNEGKVIWLRLTLKDSPVTNWAATLATALQNAPVTPIRYISLHNNIQDGDAVEFANALILPCNTFEKLDIDLQHNNLGDAVAIAFADTFNTFADDVDARNIRLRDTAVSKAPETASVKDAALQVQTAQTVLQTMTQQVTWFTTLVRQAATNVHNLKTESAEPDSPRSVFKWNAKAKKAEKAEKARLYTVAVDAEKQAQEHLEQAISAREQTRGEEEKVLSVKMANFKEAEAKQRAVMTVVRQINLRNLEIKLCLQNNQIGETGVAILEKVVQRYKKGDNLPTLVIILDENPDFVPPATATAATAAAAAAAAMKPNFTPYLSKLLRETG